MAEYRIFLPILSDRVISSLKISSLSRYQEIISKFLNILDSHRNRSHIFSSIEQRSDNYIITKNHIGLKYRGESKLELKVRTSWDQTSGIETWVKHKLGKKNHVSGDLSAYIPDILSLLSQYGVLEDSDEVALLHARSLTPSKSRITIGTGFTSIEEEVCLINLGDDYSHMCGSLAVSQWLSLCFEGELQALRNYLGSKEIDEEIFEAIKILHDALRNDLSLSQTYRLYPVIGGYPTWSCTMTSNDQVDDHMHSVIEPILTARYGRVDK